LLYYSVSYLTIR